MSKIHHTKKVIEYLNVLRKYFRVRQDLSVEIQTSVSSIKYELQTSIETNISCKKSKKKIFWLNGDGLKIDQKRTQHQRISHIWLITKHFCVNMKNCTH